MNIQTVKYLITETFKEWSDDKAGRLAAALSYYTVFSLPPLLIIILAIAGAFFDEAEAQVTAQIVDFVGETGGEAITAILENASKPSESIAAALIGVVMLLFGASGVFGQLQEAMNTIWEVPPSPKGGILNLIKDRFFSFTMVLGVGFLLMVSLVITAGLASFNEFVSNLLPGFLILAQVINFVVSLGIITMMFALIFKVIPDVHISWRDVWIGAFITAVLFTIGKWGISLYLAKSAPASSYGAAGSLIVILLWIYYSAQILFLGAEFTQVYANRFGSKITADWAEEDGGVKSPVIIPGQMDRPGADPSANSPPQINQARIARRAELPESVEPVSRLVNGLHNVLVSVLAVPAALLQGGDDRRGFRR